MAGISVPAIPTEPWRSPPVHKDIAVSSNRDSLLESQRGYNSTGPSCQTHNVSSKERTKRKEKTGLDITCAWIVQHQTGLAVNLVLLLFLTHLCYPRARHYTRKFFRLSYYDERRGRYALGWDDLFLVFYWIVMFTGLRAAAMDYILTPFAEWMGIKNKKGKARFAEQSWIVIYAGAFWSLGMYICYNSDYWLNLDKLWMGWPIRDMDGLFKWYYLAQFAFWLQQIFIVNIEERRKDHWQMFTHHIITCILIFCSYGYHFYNVGNVFLCLMDVGDIILSLAKVLKYLNYRVACDIAFGIFMVTWVITRHVLFLAVCYSAWYLGPIVVDQGCYTGNMHNLSGPKPEPGDFGHYLIPFQDPEGPVCCSPEILHGFVYMLLALQLLLCLWFGMILRVAYKVVKGGDAEDVRSDDESTDDELDREEKIMDAVPVKEYSPPPKAFFEPEHFKEEVVGAENIRLSPNKTSPSKRSKKSDSGASTTSVSLRAHGAHKELLGRIGCDKQS